MDEPPPWLLHAAWGGGFFIGALLAAASLRWLWAYTGRRASGS